MTYISQGISPVWTSHVVDLDGVNIHYLDNGGTGPVLICLHGTSMSANCWGHLAASLKDGFRVIAVDMRGHGKSDRPSSNYTMNEMAGDIAGLIERLGLESVSFIGSSVGNQVAVAYAAAHPERVAGMILSDPSFYVSDTEVVKYLRSHHTRPRNYATRAEAETFASALPQRAGLSDEMHRLAMEGDFLQEEDGSWSWAYDLLAITKVFFNISNDETPKHIAAVEAPVLIINADKSNVLTGEQAEGLAKAFKNATLETMKNSNHTIWGDQPELVAERARRFLTDFAQN